MTSGTSSRLDCQAVLHHRDLDPQTNRAVGLRYLQTYRAAEPTATRTCPSQIRRLIALWSFFLQPYRAASLAPSDGEYPDPDADLSRREMEDPSLQWRGRQSTHSTCPSQKLNIILTLLLGFNIVTTGANEMGVLFQKKRKAALPAAFNSSHEPMLCC